VVFHLQDTVKSIDGRRAPLKAFPSVFAMDTGRCLKRRTDRACSSITRAIHLRWTESFEDFFQSSTQLALRLSLIRGLTSLIRELDGIGVSPGPNADLHCGYHAHTYFLGLNGYHVASFLMQRRKRFSSR
jgi:hypothetical protein